jgi:hypothetical protein
MLPDVVATWPTLITCGGVAPCRDAYHLIDTFTGRRVTETRIHLDVARGDATLIRLRPDKTRVSPQSVRRDAVTTQQDTAR